MDQWASLRNEGRGCTLSARQTSLASNASAPTSVGQFQAT